MRCLMACFQGLTWATEERLSLIADLTLNISRAAARICHSRTSAFSFLISFWNNATFRRCAELFFISISDSWADSLAAFFEARDICICTYFTAWSRSSWYGLNSVSNGLKMGDRGFRTPAPWETSINLIHNRKIIA